MLFIALLFPFSIAVEVGAGAPLSPRPAARVLQGQIRGRPRARPGVELLPVPSQVPPGEELAGRPGQGEALVEVFAEEVWLAWVAVVTTTSTTATGARSLGGQVEGVVGTGAPRLALAMVMVVPMVPVLAVVVVVVVAAPGAVPLASPSWLLLVGSPGPRRGPLLHHWGYMHVPHAARQTGATFALLLEAQAARWIPVLHGRVLKRNGHTQVKEGTRSRGQGLCAAELHGGVKGPHVALL